MKRDILIFMVLCYTLVWCEEYQLPLSKIDMSEEEAKSNYTYFRFINRTGERIMLEFIYADMNDGWRYIIPNDHDIVETYVNGGDGFAVPEQVFEYIKVYYNYNEEYEDVVTMFYDETMTNSPMILESWDKKQVDDNSLILSYAFTKEHYAEAQHIE